MALAEAPAGGSYLAGNVGLAGPPDVLHGWIARTGADGALPRGCESIRDIPLVPRALAVAAIDQSFTVTDAALVVDHPPVTVTPVSLDAVDSCAGNLAPGEVSGSGSAFPLRVAPAGRIEWEPGQFNGALTFNLYRGDLMGVGRDGGSACLQSGLALPSTIDVDSMPGPGGWYYLVGGSNEEGEGPLGFDSRRQRTAPAGACP